MSTIATHSTNLIESCLKEMFPLHTVINKDDVDVITLWPNDSNSMEVHEVSKKLITLHGGDNLEHLGQLLRRNAFPIKRTRCHLTYKSYRVVDSSHVNKLHSLLNGNFAENKVSDVHGDSKPIIHGTLTLPGNFVLVDGFHKSVSGTDSDSELGVKYLTDNLEIDADKKIWEFEGYRLYRSLMTIDGLHNTYAKDIVQCDDQPLADPATLIANCATVSYGGVSNRVYLEINPDVHSDIISTSDGDIRPVLISISKEYYDRLRTVIETYIEFSN